jgi:hypothetical protein
LGIDLRLSDLDQMSIEIVGKDDLRPPFAKVRVQLLPPGEEARVNPQT